ncbi:putative nuclease (plasmid) [Calothrix sp. NIES-4071]|nr:putative nuclease [Calothrix sp. NIES-4071]BAZ64799.1 putative nuclease [Calothrix sp. NIES-4105]
MLRYIATRCNDKTTKAPIDGAKITLEKSGKPYIAHTDSEGLYHLNACLEKDSEFARIRVETEGYDKYNRNITLLSNNNTIEEIHITKIQAKPKKRFDLVGVSTVLGTVFGFISIVIAYQQLAPNKQDCDPSYPTLCLSQNISNLKCSDIKDRNFKVKQPDTHNFDRDKNGIGCEK